MRAQDVYTHGHQDAVLRSHRWRTAENSAAYLLPHLRPGRSLLDVGCGPGTLTADLARRVSPGRVVGVDTADVVAEAARHANEAGVQIELVQGDFRTSDLGGPFDVVHAHQVLQHLTDPVGALAAMAGLVAPGGLLAARDGDYPGMLWSPSHPALDRWLEVYLAVTRRNDANADAGRLLPQWAAQAGLGDASYGTSTWTFASPEDRSWWATMWADRTVASSLAEQAAAYGIATAGELAEVAAGWRAWAEEPSAVFVVVHGELLWRKP